MYRILCSRRTINQSSTTVSLPWQSYYGSNVGTIWVQNVRRRPFGFSHRQLSGNTDQSRKQEFDISSLNSLENDQAKLPNIRERLRLWEEANGVQALQSVVIDMPVKGTIKNPLLADAFDGRILDKHEDLGNDDIDSQSPFFEAGELVDFGDTRPFLLKGDMVDLSVVNSVQPEFAIYIRDIEGVAQYYTMTGRWVHSKARSVFCVPQFVDPEEVDKLLPYLPTTISMSEEDKLQSFKKALPREIGAPLVNEMLDFWRKTQVASLRFGERLRYAHKIMASQNVLRYCTLEQVADRLLPTTVDRLPNGKFPQFVLYAVHMALMDDASGFRPQRGAEHRYGTRYEVNPKIQELIIREVTQWVRKFQEEVQVKGRRSDDLPLVQFISKARQLIDKSRKHRELTKNGTLGPITRTPGPNNFSVGSSKQKRYEEFSASDVYIIRFIEYWCALTSFSNYSLAHGIGSQILRATGRYADFDLNQDIGWVFLQEIGVVLPWETRAVFDLRLPDIGFQLSEKEDPVKRSVQDTDDVLLKDRMEALRTDWGSTPVYCIDDISAHEIDDGVSLEKIQDSTNEYWVHIHTADPASHIEPSSEIGKHAQQMGSSAYLLERMAPMIPRDVTVENFSLANNRPSLTFSARMNNAGDIIETKITPGYVHNVKFVTPPVVEEIVSGRKPTDDQGNVYTVGESISSTPHTTDELGRKMLQLSDFTEEDKENLRILHSLGFARRQKAIERGALPPTASKFLNKVNPSISVQLNEDTFHPLVSPFHCTSDPTIEYKPGFEEDPEMQKTTTNLMLLGGEISARWCHDRNIPIAYRVTPWSPKSTALSEFVQKVLLPSAESGELTAEQINEYKTILGVVKPSTTPGPHLGLGVSKFARCTSPLRRYSDLLLHWQVQAALLEEAKTGESLVGSTREDYLPFKKRDVDEIIPALEGRERYIQRSQKFAREAITSQFVLRAWKYNQSNIPLPKTFQCTFSGFYRASDDRTLGLDIGFLNSTGRGSLPDWLKKKDVKLGDIFECEFEDVSAYLGHIYLKVLRRVR